MPGLRSGELLQRRAPGERRGRRAGMQQQLRLLGQVRHHGPVLHSALLRPRLARPQTRELQRFPATGLLWLRNPRYTAVMLVIGGRPGWARVSVLFGLLGAACGSRTSMLDLDAYSSPGSGGANNVAGSGNRSGSPGKGGSPSDPNAVDPSKSVAACTRYCKGYRVQCADELGNRDCLETCAQEVNNNGKQCQTFGIEVLNCLAPLFPTTGPSQGCDAVSNRAAATCSAELGKFQGCKPATTPTPNPEPVDTCTITEQGGAGDCVQIYECADGPYVVQCSNTYDGTHACACIAPNGASQFAMYGGTANPCQTAALNCGFL
jgi:hypothetical protein